jgi:TatA/E family protein of Tat protein translocase
MFGIGMTELLVILAVALIVFGPKRLPELARSLGRALGEFRRASTDLRQQLNEVGEAARGETEPELRSAPDKRTDVSETPAEEPERRLDEPRAPTPAREAPAAPPKVSGDSDEPARG